MITISPMQAGQVAEARRLITAVAQRIFEPGMSVEQFAAVLEREHELDDMDHYQEVYGGGRGIFLVVLDGARLVGTGALRPLDEHTAELKRIWLLEEYHGRGLGLRLVRALLGFARQAGYGRVVLQTSLQSARALGFYRKLGFKEIAPYFPLPYEDDVFMALDSF